MEIEARVTRSLRRRLNSVDLDVKSNGRSTTPISELDILKEGPTTTPSRRGRKLLYSENDGETLEKTPVNRTTRRRSVTESPAFSGTPLRKTRRNSTSGVDLTNENIGTTTKNLKKSFITEVVLEEISTDDDLEKSPEKKKMNLMIKIPKLKSIEISPTRTTDSNKFQNQKKNNSENVNIVKNKYNEPKNELNHDCGENNGAQISYDKTLPFSMSLRKNRLSPKPNMSVNKTKNLETEITQSVVCFNKEIERNIEKSSPTLQNCKFNNSPKKMLVLPSNSKTNDSSKNNSLSLSESKINNQSAVIPTDNENQLVSESQFSEINKTNFKIKAESLKKDESEYCETSLNESESSLRNSELSKKSDKNQSLRNAFVNEKSTKNISKPFNLLTEEKSNECDTPEKTANKSLNISKAEENLSNSDSQELIRENVTETKLKSVTFNGEESYSEKKFCQFPKTPISIKIKSCVRIENSDSPTKLNSSQIETNGSEKINDFEIDKILINDTPNKGAKTNINASSTPLVEYVDVNLRNKKNHLLISKQENNSDVFSKSWTQSVRRSTSKKIDTLSLSMYEEKTFNSLSTSKTKENKMKINSGDLESNDSQENSSEKSENDNEFIDNEAEEVEEEDSIDEEERQYIEENEFVEKGISLGSEDTDHSNNNESSEYNSFIVSDNEENDIFSLDEISRNSSDDKFNTITKLKKKYKRIKEMNSDIDDENFENNKGGETNENLTQNIEVNCNYDLEVQQTNLINSPETYLNSRKSQNNLTNEFNVSNITQSSKNRKNSLKLEQNSIMCTDNDNKTIENNNAEINLDGKSKDRLNKSNENSSLCKANVSGKDEKLDFASEMISNLQGSSKNESFCQFKQKNKKDNALSLEVSKFIDQSSSEEDEGSSPNTSKRNQSKKDPISQETFSKMISEETVESSIKILYENSNSQDHIRKNNTKIKENDVTQSFNHSKNYRNLSETITVPESYNDYIAEGVIDEESSNLTEYDSHISTTNIPTSLSFTSCLPTNFLKNAKTSLSFTEGFAIKNTKYLSSSESGDSTTNSSQEIENECTNSNIEKKELENTSSAIEQRVCDMENNNITEHAEDENVQLIKSQNITSKEFKDETVNLHKTANFKCFSISETNESKQVINYSHILKRCNEILNAANEAKLKEKLKKKNEILKNGKKTCVAGNFKNTEKIEKLKHKKAVSKAIVCAQTILTKTKNSSDERQFQIKDKILALEIVETMFQEQNKINSDSNIKKLDQKFKMEAEEYHNNLENKKNMSTNLISTSSGIFLEEPVTPKKKKVEKIELATGTVFEEPITPIGLHKKNGFMESPVTPIGFKVRRIISAGQENIPEFNIRKHKRKLIDEPVHVLPQRVWSSSGEFVEEVYKPLNNKNKNVRTEFYAVPLKTKKLKSNQNYCGVINKNALDFKKNALASTGSYRETSKQLLQRKERQKFY